MSNSGFRQPVVKSSQGLSLIEVSVAIAIMAIILVSLSGIFNQGYLFLRKTRMKHLACFLAQEQMENLTHDYIFADISSFNGIVPLSGPFLGFNRQVTVTSPAPQAYGPLVKARLAEIIVRVSWLGQSVMQDVTLTSLVSNSTH